MIFQLVTSAAVSGQGGARVFFRGSPFLLCSTHVHWQTWDQREEATTLSWRMELGGAVVPHRRDGDPLLLCIDSNARAGSVASEFIG